MLPLAQTIRDGFTPSQNWGKLSAWYSNPGKFSSNSTVQERKGILKTYKLSETKPRTNDKCESTQSIHSISAGMATRRKVLKSPLTRIESRQNSTKKENESIRRNSFKEKLPENNYEMKESVKKFNFPEIIIEGVDASEQGKTSWNVMDQNPSLRSNRLRRHSI